MGGAMLTWAALFFCIAIVAGLLGYTNIAGSAMAMAQVLFFIFLIGAMIFLAIGLTIASKASSIFKKT
jgi:uncharacterized membrane protein YtjA (UPF0391 family)